MALPNVNTVDMSTKHQQYRTQLSTWYTMLDKLNVFNDPDLQEYISKRYKKLDSSKSGMYALWMKQGGYSITDLRDFFYTLMQREVGKAPSVSIKKVKETDAAETVSSSGGVLEPKDLLFSWEGKENNLRGRLDATYKDSEETRKGFVTIMKNLVSVTFRGNADAVDENNGLLNWFKVENGTKVQKSLEEIISDTVTVFKNIESSGKRQNLLHKIYVSNVSRIPVVVPFKFDAEYVNKNGKAAPSFFPEKPINSACLFRLYTPTRKSKEECLALKAKLGKKLKSENLYTYTLRSNDYFKFNRIPLSIVDSNMLPYGVLGVCGVSGDSNDPSFLRFGYLSFADAYRVLAYKKSH